MRTEFDYSMMNDYQVCPRMYYYRHILGLTRKVKQTAPAFGHSIHKALDSWYVDKDVEKAVSIFKADYKEDLELDDKRTHVMGDWILRNYHTTYQSMPWKLLATEQAFTIPLPNGNNLLGRIDKIVEWNGAVWVIDHKTTSQLGAQYFKMIEPSLQFPGYVYAARQLGFPAVGVVVDAILVAKGLLKAATRANLTPLARYDDYVADWQLNEWMETAMRIQKTIVASEVSDVWIPNFGSCTHYGECAYRQIDVEEPGVRQRVIEHNYNRGDFWDPRKETE